MNGLKSGCVVYPTGYALPTSQHSGISVLSEGDQAVVELFTHYRLGKLRLTSYDVFKQAVDNATRLFGKDHKWIMVQQRNQNLDRNKALFIADTLEYIVSGKRRMHVRSWLPLVDTAVQGTVLPILMNGPVVHGEISLPPQLIGNSAKLLAAWLSHNDGLGDLIESTNILFGGATY